jgi:hypothetical protein
MMIPVVSRLVPERHEKPFKGSSGAPIQFFLLTAVLLGLLTELYCQEENQT